jgi:protein PhnA
MSDHGQNCPQCNSANGYLDGALWTCPECFHEWDPQAAIPGEITPESEGPKFRDANGIQLENGDTVITVKDLKVGKETMKSGTKVKNIRLLDEPLDGHDIACKIPEYGSMYLKCSVVKKVK